MSAATTTLTSTPTAKTPKSKQTMIVILRLRPDLLAKLAPKPTLTPSKQNGTQPDTPAVEGDNTPDPDAAKKKTTPAAKPGVKRTSSAATLDKPKGRPGPKKKPRLADGTIDRINGTKASSAAPAGASNAHKLGPKANMGAINAGLRALDRSGKACRKWERKGFALKSFTGVSWGVGSWSAPLRASSTFSGDAKSDSSSAVDVKPTMESSLVPSDSSRSGDIIHPAMNGMASSPTSVTA